MPSRVTTWVAFGRIMLDAIHRDRLEERAAAIAFNLVLTIPPLCLIALLIGSVWLDQESVVMRATAFMTRVFGVDVGVLFWTIFDSVMSLQSRVVASFIGIVVLVFAGTRTIYSIRSAFWDIFDLPQSFISTLRFTLIQHVQAFVLLFMSLFLIMSLVIVHLSVTHVTLILSAFLDVDISRTFLSLMGSYLSVLLTTVYLFFFYRIVSHDTAPVRTVFVGALFAAAGVVLLTITLSLLVSWSMSFKLYGIASSLIAFLLWVYYGTLIILLGGELIKAVMFQKLHTHDPVPQS